MEVAMGHYDVAQICLNGHFVNSDMMSFPEFNKEYCDRCGDKTINTCQHCNTDIQGSYEEEDIVFAGKYVVPKYCHSCGNSFPWTESILKASHELIDIQESLNEDEKKELMESIIILTKDTPLAEVAKIKFKKIVSKLPSQMGESIKNIITDIISESVRKSIYGS